jgi:hypothetical protein
MFLPATVKILEAILQKPFHLFHHILNDVTNITKALSLHFEGTGKNYWEQGQECVGDAPMLPCCSLLRNP